MLLIVSDSAGEGPERIYRTVNSHNIKKVAKSIHSLYPWSDYPSLEGCIFNAYAKGKKELELEVPNRA